MKHFISIIGLALVVGVGFLLLSNYVGTAYGQSSSLITSDTVSGTSVTGSQVVALLNRLKSIQLAADGKIFTSPAFMSLQDWSIDIAPQPIGRPNPFLPTALRAQASLSTSNKPTISVPGFLVK